MKLILGSAQFGFRYGLKKTKINKKEFQNIYKMLKQNSLTYFDTAINYGDSQKRIGTLNIKKKIITKIKIPTIKPKNLEKWYYQILFRTLKDLKVKKLYGLLLHDSSHVFKNKELLNIILESKKKKLVSKIGISVYEKFEIEKVLRIWKPDIIQIPINVFDQRFLNGNFLKKLNQLKIQIHVRSCFLNGLLLENRLKKGKIVSKNKFEEFVNWCKLKKINQLTACINFVKRIKYVHALIVGFNNSKQLEEILYSFKKKTILVPGFYINEKKIIDPRKWKIN